MGYGSCRLHGESMVRRHPLVVGIRLPRIGVLYRASALVSRVSIPRRMQDRAPAAIGHGRRRVSSVPRRRRRTVSRWRRTVSRWRRTVSRRRRRTVPRRWRRRVAMAMVVVMIIVWRGWWRRPVPRWRRTIARRGRRHLRRGRQSGAQSKRRRYGERNPSFHRQLSHGLRLGSTTRPPKVVRAPSSPRARRGRGVLAAAFRRYVTDRDGFSRGRINRPAVARAAGAGESPHRRRRRATRPDRRSDAPQSASRSACPTPHSRS